MHLYEPIRSQCTHMPNSLNLFFSAYRTVSIISSIPEVKHDPCGAHTLTVVKICRHLKSINFKRFPITNFIFKNKLYWRIALQKNHLNFNWNSIDFSADPPPIIKSYLIKFISFENTIQNYLIFLQLVTARGVGWHCVSNTIKRRITIRNIKL